MEKNDLRKAQSKPCFTKPILFHPDVLAYLGTLHWKYVIVPIEKASNNFGFVYKKFIFLKFFQKWGSITTSNPIPHIQKQTFLKMILLKIMKTIVKNLN